MNELTITFPAISEQVIADLDATETVLAETEVAFVRALRERFAGLAKHNGNIMIADYDMVTSNYRIDKHLYYERDGKRVRGLLALDDFDKDYTDQNRGDRFGTRLYLLASGEWLRIERSGHWTQWQGEAQWWGCGVSANANEDWDNSPAPNGDIRVVTDAEVAEEYKATEIADQLAFSLTELAKKLSERLTRKRALAESLRAVLAQMGAK